MPPAEASYVNEPNYPRENITYSEAAEFCQTRGGRILTEAEMSSIVTGSRCDIPIEGI